MLACTWLGMVYNTRIIWFFVVEESLMLPNNFQLALGMPSNTGALCKKPIAGHVLIMRAVIQLLDVNVVVAQYRKMQIPYCYVSVKHPTASLLAISISQYSF